MLHIDDDNGEERARVSSDFTSEEIRVLIVNPDLPAAQLHGYQTHSQLIRPDNLNVLEDRNLPWGAPAMAD